VNETAEEHSRGGKEPILKEIKERDIKGNINRSNTDTQGKLG
jgi:hypothetical protein